MTWVSFRFAVCFAWHLALAKAQYDKDCVEAAINGEFVRPRKKNKGQKRRQWWADKTGRSQEGGASHSWGSGPRPPQRSPPRPPPPPPPPWSPPPSPPPPPPPYDEEAEDEPLTIVETPGP